jgi:hypothetical protein
MTYCEIGSIGVDTGNGSFNGAIGMMQKNVIKVNLNAKQYNHN